MALAGAAMLLSFAGCGDDATGDPSRSPDPGATTPSASAAATAMSPEVAARLARLKSDVKTASSAMEYYFAENETYPTRAADLDLTPSDTQITVVEADGGSYRLCATDGSGGWASFSSEGGIVDSGGTGGVCP